MKAAITFSAPAPRITAAAAVPTRSLGACAMASIVSTFKYVQFAARYSAITPPAPSNKESGTVLRGFRTSPAVKVMLFQASAANSDPTMATATNRNVANENPAPRHMLVKLSCDAAALCPPKYPARISPSSAAILVNVNRFCTHAPALIPKQLMMVSTMMQPIATQGCAAGEMG